MSLQSLYDRLVKKPQEEKGVRLVNNPFTLGSDVVDESGKVLFSGDDISCAVYINQLPNKPPKP
jgi:hypothetical protein